MRSRSKADVRDVVSAQSSPPSADGPIQRYKPDARQCALLMLALIESKEAEIGRSISRCRIAEISLKRLWCRSRLSPQFVEGVCEWLENAGIVLFYAGSSYGLVRVSVVQSWNRLTSKRLQDTVVKVAEGTFVFDQLDHLLKASKDSDIEDD